MREVIGVIGAAGDLGSQLCTRLHASGYDVLKCDPHLPGTKSSKELFEIASIVHICAPLEALDSLADLPAEPMIILHDSVMNTSRLYNDTVLKGQGAIVHLLMNSRDTAVIASDAAHSAAASSHLQHIGCSIVRMSIDEHDRCMARSQAPLALLIETLLPDLYEQEAKGTLTNSGELLAKTLRARQAAWTLSTIHSILKNPHIESVITDMQNTLEQVRYNTIHD